MSVAVPLEDLLVYSDHERRKWRDWFAADPRRLDIPFQPGARFPTLGALLDHTFLIERRHLSRLEGATPPDATGLAPGDWARLFEFADLVRADMRRYVADLDDARAAEIATFSAPVSVVPTGSFSISRRKLLAHIVLHEVRHFAQMAFAARAAGHPPPGEHDIFFCPELP